MSPLDINIIEYLKLLEEYTINLGTSAGYPCSCQESSMLLYMWLKSSGIDSKIVFGDYNDPVINKLSPHFWVETKDLIIDGTTVQFLLPNYEKGYPFTYLKQSCNLGKCKMIYKRNNKKYSNKVAAYVPDDMIQYIESVSINSYSTISTMIHYAKELIYPKLKEDMKYSFFTSLYLNNKKYYGLDEIGFMKKCQSQNREEVLKYVRAI